MERYLLNLLCIARRLSVEDFFVIAADQVPSHHSLRLADDFELLLVHRSLNDAVAELDD